MSFRPSILDCISPLDIYGLAFLFILALGIFLFCLVLTLFY